MTDTLQSVVDELCRLREAAYEVGEPFYVSQEVADRWEWQLRQALAASGRDAVAPLGFVNPKTVQSFTAGKLQATLSRSKRGGMSMPVFARMQNEEVAYPEMVIGLLIAGGHVTQKKVDEARAIALGLDRTATTEGSDNG